jgi:hypothetical protein
MTGAVHLTSGVLAAVLGAALLHALWNSLVKSADDKFLSSALIALWCGVAAFAATLVLPWPSRAAAPFIAASALIHIVYFLLVGRLYRNAAHAVPRPLRSGGCVDPGKRWPYMAKVLSLPVFPFAKYD